MLGRPVPQRGVARAGGQRGTETVHCLVVVTRQVEQDAQSGLPSQDSGAQSQQSVSSEQHIADSRNIYT